MREPTPVMPAYRRNRYQDPNFQEHYICLGYKIASLRKSTGISQQHFASFVGISRSYLSKLEQGMGIAGVSMEVIFKIAQCLNISVSQLMRLRTTDYKSCNKKLTEHYEKVEFFRNARQRFLERNRLTP